MFLQAVANKPDIQQGVIFKVNSIKLSFTFSSGGTEQFDGLFQQRKRIVIHTVSFSRQTEKQASEGLPCRLDIPVERVRQKMPTQMDSISCKGKNTKRTTLNEGGF